MIAYSETERKSEVLVQEKSFAKILEVPKTRKPGEKKEESDEEKERNRTSRRILSAGTPAAKLNLLATKDPKTIAALLQTLYAAHFDENDLTALATNLTGKKVTSFLDLYPEDEELSHLYYTLLRGTRHYDLKTGEGYPPLADFLDLSESPHLFSFKTAAPEVIRAHFGSDIAAQIFHKEEELLKNSKEKRKDLNKGEVENLARKAILTQNLSFDVPTLYETASTIAATDKTTKLRVTKHVE